MKFDSGTLSEANKQTLADLCVAQADSPEYLASSLLTSAELDFTALKHSQGLAKLQTAKTYCAASTLPVINAHLAAEIEAAVGSALADLGRYSRPANTRRVLYCLFIQRHEIHKRSEVQLCGLEKLIKRGPETTRSTRETTLMIILFTPTAFQLRVTRGRTRPSTSTS